MASNFVASALMMFLFVGLAYGQKQRKTDAQPTISKPKSAEVYVDNVRNPTYVKVDGVWEPDNPTKQNEVVFSVVQITCYRRGGREFAGSDPFCLVATATPVAGTIHVDTNWFRVVEWNSTEIILVDDSPDCIISQTTFDLTSKTVVGLDIRKPNAKGLFDACKMLRSRTVLPEESRGSHCCIHRLCAR